MKINLARPVRILAGLLAVQIALTAVTYWPRAAAGEAASLFPGLDVSTVTRIEIDAGTGEEIVLAKSDDAWVLPEADDYPVAADKVSALLEKVAALRTDRLVATTAESQARLQVADSDYVARAAMQTADGTEHVLYLGSSPGYNSTHMRAGSEEATYLTSAITRYDVAATPASWVETSYLGLTSADLQAVALHNAQGDLSLTLGEDGLWALAGLRASETLDQARVQSLIGRAATFNITAPLGREAQADYGLDEPAAELVLTTAGGEITVQIGALDEDEASYIVKSSASEYYVKVASYSVQDLVEATRDGLLVIKETPTPAPTGSPAS
jgi:hypothetical protein